MDRSNITLADYIIMGITTDGAHHKQWCLERIAEILNLELPEHDEGVAP